MNDDEMRNLADGWIAHAHEFRENKENDKNWWAYMKMSELESTDPECYWRMILLILSLNQDNVIVENLSAGPLENLLAKHGNQFIDRIETEARRNPRFTFLLGGVWQNATSDDIWARVEAARGHKRW